MVIRNLNQDIILHLRYNKNYYKNHYYIMIDLIHNQYSMDILKKHIYEVNLWDIIKKQKINEEFVVKYILNPRYQLTESEKCINIEDVLFFQPGLKREKICFYLKKIDFKDDDSVDKFDTYIN